MSLQERTLVIKNFDPEKTTSGLLRELCLQGGPVRNVVVKPDHAFIEFEDVESVGYSKALLGGVELFGKKLTMEPKIREAHYLKYTKLLNDYINYDKQRQQAVQQQQQQLLAYCNTNYQTQLSNTQTVLTNQTIGLVQPAYLDVYNQSRFAAPYQHTSTSMPRHNDNLNRSRSFTHNYQQRHNQPNRSRSGVRPRRN